MKEIITLADTEGTLDILGDATDTALLLNGEVIQLTFLQQVGTTWRYQIGRNITEADLIANQQFTEFVKRGELTSEPLSRQFAYILGLLAPGRYELTITTSEDGLLDWEDVGRDYYCRDVYGDLEEVIATQAIENEEVIAEYRSLIQQGQQPVVVLLRVKGSRNTFVIDGHHKYCAYGRLKLPACCLLITRLDAKKLDQSLGMAQCRRCGEAAGEFQRQFLKKKWRF